jgi:hypothetical protein
MTTTTEPEQFSLGRFSLARDCVPKGTGRSYRKRPVSFSLKALARYSYNPQFERFAIPFSAQALASVIPHFRWLATLSSERNR